MIVLESRPSPGSPVASVMNNVIAIASEPQQFSLGHITLNPGQHNDNVAQTVSIIFYPRLCHHTVHNHVNLLLTPDVYLRISCTSLCVNADHTRTLSTAKLVKFPDTFEGAVRQIVLHHECSNIDGTHHLMRCIIVEQECSVVDGTHYVRDEENLVELLEHAISLECSAIGGTPYMMRWM
ncbi:hypothetical protein BaRGS_00030112 [Batillaria attramentaria]|uniref:Uncharacterized protein n=1 Tax=Batillaria attramentaria TaxID=370345 RepID=A0ABD0JVC2_9CAEN